MLPLAYLLPLSQNVHRVVTFYYLGRFPLPCHNLTCSHKAQLKLLLSQERLQGTDITELTYLLRNLRQVMQSIPRRRL